MARAFALVPHISPDLAEILRRVLVWGCALALIAAGPALPALF
ncbi:hypothetical protein [Altererythrobacter sp. CC-YST694]|nr:hypothetical protein [Altererythrobacter sp. CC-YST694]